MKEIKDYTPGPWLVSEPKTQVAFGNQTYFSVYRKNSYDATGFFYPSSVQSDKTMKANAELISCAPELYEENQKLRNEIIFLKDSIDQLKSRMLKVINGK